MKKLMTLALALLVAVLTAGVAQAKEQKDKPLPPGLQKKVERGQSLPPGWQKKLAVGEPLEKDVMDQGEVIGSDKKNGTVTVKVEDKVIKVMEDTRTILDIIEGK